MNQVQTIQLGIVTHGPLLLFTPLCFFLSQKLLALGNTNEVTHSYMQGINVQDIVQDLQFVEAYLNQLGMFTFSMVIAFFCLYYQSYWYAKMVVCQTITILSHITCTLLL